MWTSKVGGGETTHSFIVQAIERGPHVPELWALLVCPNSEKSFFEIGDHQGLSREAGQILRLMRDVWLRVCTGTSGVLLIRDERCPF